jgi:starch-binding outer membrane protein, SusD/RagB family
MKLNNIFLTVFIPFILLSCKKQLEVNPPLYTANEATIFESDVTAVSAIAGIYTDLSRSIMWTLSVYPGLSADELTPNSITGSSIEVVSYYRNALNSSVTRTFNYWTVCYRLIFEANAAIEGLTKSNKITPAVKKQLLAESKFIRAFCYFYLVNLYGKAALVTGTSYKINQQLDRRPEEEIYDLIVKDLLDAQADLSSDFLDGNVLRPSDPEERVRPTKWAATALLARTYLYLKKYDLAEIESTKVIEQNERFKLVPLNDIFLKNSLEAIWQIQPVNNGQNTQDGRFFVISSAGLINARPVHLSENLLDQFEQGDARRNAWIGSITVAGQTYSYPYKYKVFAFFSPDITEYTMVLRLAEQYLIRAECRIKQNNVEDGIADINTVRTRARAEASTTIPDPLPNLDNNLADEEALNAVYHERRVELFTEWGQRWFDLKRTGLVNDVMSMVTQEKGGTWKPEWAFYPLGSDEILRAPNLGQTPGY